jgi:hypothetical protein
VVVRGAGEVLGNLEPGAAAFEADLPSSGSTLPVELQTEGFSAGGRRLGTVLELVRLTVPARAFPSLGLLACFLLPTLAVGLAGVLSGVPEPLAAALAAAVAALEGLALHPSGVLLSSETVKLGALLTLGSLVCALVARQIGTEKDLGLPGRAWAYLAFLLALILLVAAISPLMIVSDAVFQANKLRAVSGGDLFPTSETQHTPPFRFPYGVSFFALLAPLFRLGLDPVDLVRWAAPVSAFGASVGAFYLVARRGAARAGLAVILLLLLPGAFDLYSYGNLSNVFAQAATVLFFVWWARDGTHWAGLGALLFLLAALGHFSSFLVLLFLSPALAFLGGHDLRKDRFRALALGLGLVLSLLYYGSFVPLVLAQLGRLGEGGGRHGFALLTQGREALKQWGLPVVLLALFGRPRRGEGGLDKDLSAFWGAGMLLFLLAVLTPLDVRYLYALSLPLAIAAGTGAERLIARGGIARIAAVLLLAAQLVLMASETRYDVLARYRPREPTGAPTAP